MRSIEEINKEIVELFKERTAILDSQERPFKEIYTVFNSETGSIDDNTFVLNPLKKRDLEYLGSYAENLPEGTLRESLLDWLREYTNFKCVRGRICPITESPVCCAHCYNNSVCFESEESNMCSYVMIGDVIVVSDCIDED